jgi:hypothetical protein
MFSENENNNFFFCIIGVWPTVYARITKVDKYIFLTLKVQENE